MGIRFAYYTNKGTKKHNNEDALVVRTASTVRGPLLMAGVCDGVGGMDRGELASSIAVHALSEWFDEKLPLYLRDGFDFVMLRSGLEFELLQINKLLQEQASISGCHMGTTATMLILFEGRCITANVGDSRIYEIGNTIRQLTKDHSLVQREIDLGHLTKDDAEKDQRRNVLFQCLGAKSKVAPDICERPVKLGVVYLLCSDGFRHRLTPAEMKEELLANAERGEAAINHALESMAKRCMERGETDNITAIALWAEQLR